MNFKVIPSVFDFYYYVTNYHRFKQLKTMRIYHLTVSIDQNSCQNLDGSFAKSHKLQSAVG